MPRCDSCGAFVSADFHRVFSRGGRLEGCVECSGHGRVVG